jgi:hypothetical protein
MAEPALAAHAGLAQGEQGDVLFETRQLVAVGAQGVDQGMDALGEKDTLKVVLHEGLGLGVDGQERFDLLVGNARPIIFDDRPSSMVAIMQPVVGDHLQPLCLVHVGHHGRTRKGVDNGADALGGVLPDPVDQLLLAADVVGDVLGALFWRRLLPSLLFGRLASEILGIDG